MGHEIMSTPPLACVAAPTSRIDYFQDDDAVRVPPAVPVAAGGGQEGLHGGQSAAVQRWKPVSAPARPPAVTMGRQRQPPTPVALNEWRQIPATVLTSEGRGRCPARMGPFDDAAVDSAVHVPLTFDRSLTSLRRVSSRADADRPAPITLFLRRAGGRG